MMAAWYSGAADAAQLIPGGRVRGCGRSARRSRLVGEHVTIRPGCESSWAARGGTRRSSGPPQQAGRQAVALHDRVGVDGAGRRVVDHMRLPGKGGGRDGLPASAVRQQGGGQQPAAQARQTSPRTVATRQTRPMCYAPKLPNTRSSTRCPLGRRPRADYLLRHDCHVIVRLSRSAAVTGVRRQPTEGTGRRRTLVRLRHESGRGSRSVIAQTCTSCPLWVVGHGYSYKGGDSE